MTRTPEQIIEERRQIRARYGELFDSVVALLFRHDPVGINFEHNTDEYESEAGTILPRLHTCKSVDDVRRVVYEEFVRWFALSSGPEDQYGPIASDIWELWQRERISRDKM